MAQQIKKNHRHAEMTETDSCSFNTHANIWMRVQMAAMQKGNIHHSKASATQHRKWCWDVSEGQDQSQIRILNVFWALQSKFVVI